MKQIILIVFAFAILCTSNISAQSLSNIFDGNPELKALFVNPAGLDQNIDSADAKSLDDELNLKGTPFNTFDMGAYGKIYILPQNKVRINGVDIDKTILVVNDNYSGIMYISQPSDNFSDICSYIGKQMEGLSVSEAEENYESSGINIYMVSDKYGVGVVADPDRKVAMVALMDMKDLKSFLQMGMPK